MPNFFADRLSSCGADSQGLSVLLTVREIEPRRLPQGSYLWCQKVAPNHPHVARGNNLRPALSGRSKEQDYAASAPGHAGCRLFFLRCKRECGGLKLLPGAIVGFCASCLSERILPATFRGERLRLAKKAFRRCVTKSASGGDGLFTNPRISPEPALAASF